MSATLALAGRGRRFVATLIDVVLVPVVAVLLMLVTGVLEHAADWSFVLLNLWLLWTRGQTVGKAAMGITIVDAKSGERAPIWRLFIRGLFFPTLFMIVLLPYVALVPVIDQALIFRKDRRCVHDWICRTVVVTRP